MESAQVKDAMDQAITVALNEVGEARQCRPLEWHVDASWSTIIASGFAGDEYSQADVLSVLAEWQALFDLDEIDDPAIEGTRTLTGTLQGGLIISITGVIDQAAYRADAETFTTADA
jgi:hypothetical protein